MTSESSRMQAINSAVGIQSLGNVHVAGNVIVNSSQQKQIELQKYNFPPLVNSFCGREEDIEQLDSLFFQQNKHKVVICGVPGYGKSEVAKHFARKCQDEGKVEKIFWVNAENIEDINNFFRDLLKIMNLSELESKPQDVVYEHLKGYKTMFIFDNGLNRRSIVSFEPPHSNNFWLLITSQTKDWGSDVMSYELDCLTSDSAVEVLLTNLINYYQEKDRELYRELAELFGNVPLGLPVSSAYVLQRMKSAGQYFDLQKYVNEIKQNEHVHLDKTISENCTNIYANSIYTAFRISFEKLYNNENINFRDLASNVLFVVAFLDPEHITLDVLLQMPNIEELLQSCKKGKTMLRETLSLIDNFSFIRYDPNSSRIWLHRFIQEIVRYHMRASDEQARHHCYDACLEFLLKLLLKYDRYNMHIEIFEHSIILKYADENADTFYKFYKRNKNLLLSTSLKSNSKIFRNILIGLIKWNSTDSLKKIFTDIGDGIVGFNYYILNSIPNVFRCGCTKQVSANIKEYISVINLLHEASHTSSLESTKVLLEFDVDINSKTESQETPLHIAARNWDFEAIQFLIEHEADINIRNNSGEIPLFAFVKGARDRRHESLDGVADILDLLGCSENVNDTNGYGKTLMYTAAHSWHIDLLILLLTKYDVDINIPDCNGATLWHAIISLLSINYYSYFENRPLEYSEYSRENVNWEEVIRLIETLKVCGARFDDDPNILWMPVKISQKEEYLFPCFSGRFLISYAKDQILQKNLGDLGLD